MDGTMLSASPSMADPLQLQHFSRQPRPFGGSPMQLLPHMASAGGQETTHMHPQQQQQQQHHCFGHDVKSLGRSSSRCKPSQSEEDEPSFTEDGTDGSKCGKKEKDTSPWHRMKWTDEMVRILITAVLWVGEEGDCAHEGNVNSKRKSGILQKKGKWKSVSKLMNSKGHPVSPQQCEDKFNDLNKRYKRLNDVLGRGTACEVVENPSLLDKMGHLSDKAKDDVRKILSSKHLFYREMCAYHNGNRIHLESDHGLQHSGMMIMHHAARTRDGHELFRPAIEDTSGGCGGGGDENEEEDIKEEEEDDEDDEDDDNENEGDPEIEGGMEESMKRARMNTNWEDINLWSSPGSQEFGRPNAQDNFSQELMGVLQDPTKAEWQKRQWMKSRTMQLEEQKVMIQAEAFELEKQRVKWKKFRSRKDRELDKLKLENERMKLENDRMALQLKEKELELEFKRSEASMPSVTLKMDRFRGMEQHDMVRGESMQ